MCYTDRQINNRIAKIADLEAQKKVLEEQIKSLKEEIMQDMGEEEMRQTSTWKISATTVTQKRVDSTFLKKTFPEAYLKSLKESTYRRFSYSAI